MLNNPVQEFLIRMQQTSPRSLTRDLPLRAIVFLVCSISMTPVADAARLEEIIVTAARRPESALRTAASIARVTSEAIATVGSTLRDSEPHAGHADPAAVARKA